MVAAGLVGSAAGFAMVGYAVGGNPFIGKGDLFLEMVQLGRLIPEVTALVVVYGSAMLFPVLTRAGQVPPALRRDARAQGLLELAFMAPFALALAWGAGGNAERYLFWAFPIVVMGAMPHIEALIRARRYVLWAFGVLFTSIFQHAFVPIAATGMAGCDIGDAVVGRGTFVGHWTMPCSEVDAFEVIGVYVLVCAAGIALAYGSSVIADRRRQSTAETDIRLSSSADRERARSARQVFRRRARFAPASSPGPTSAPTLRTMRAACPDRADGCAWWRPSRCSRVIARILAHILTRPPPSATCACDVGHVGDRCGDCLGLRVGPVVAAARASGRRRTRRWWRCAACRWPCASCSPTPIQRVSTRTSRRTWAARVQAVGTRRVPGRIVQRSAVSAERRVRRAAGAVHRLPIAGRCARYSMLHERAGDGGGVRRGARAWACASRPGLVAGGLVAVLPWALYYGRISLGGELIFHQLLLLAALARLIWPEAIARRRRRPGRGPPVDAGWREALLAGFALAMLLWDYLRPAAPWWACRCVAALPAGWRRLWCLAVPLVGLVAVASAPVAPTDVRQRRFQHHGSARGDAAPTRSASCSSACSTRCGPSSGRWARTASSPCARPRCTRSSCWPWPALGALTGVRRGLFLVGRFPRRHPARRWSARCSASARTAS